jgi:hypothetical protein
MQPKQNGRFYYTAEPSISSNHVVTPSRYFFLPPFFFLPFFFFAITVTSTFT